MTRMHVSETFRDPGPSRIQLIVYTIFFQIELPYTILTSKILPCL